MKEKIIKLGVIADDFTGASDAASFLVRNGYQTIMLTEIPNSFEVTCDCVVVALKVRSVEPEIAINEVKRVLNFFEKNGVEKIYYKYCSTFDSTPKGNIGVILDYLMDELDVNYTLICPSLPINGRQVKDGILYVNQIPLAESSMKNHPLNPMWDSYIPTLMKSQSKYPCYVVKREVEFVYPKNHKYYLVPDYETEEDGKRIAFQAKDMKLLSGGSGLLEHIVLKADRKKNQTVKDSFTKAIIICGSCSAMTKKQVENYIEKGNPGICIDSLSVFNGEVNIDELLQQIIANLPYTTLIYSDGINQDMSVFSKRELFEELSMKMENFNSKLSKEALNKGFDRIIVAGGETSGAVVLNLGYQSFFIGKVIAPGVPVLVPTLNPSMQLILKSGNFGDEEFFSKALK